MISSLSLKLWLFEGWKYDTLFTCSTISLFAVYDDVVRSCDKLI